MAVVLGTVHDCYVADGELLEELNRDIWRAFRSAYAAGDAQAFLALHTADLIRAGGPERSVIGLDEYTAQTSQWFAWLVERGAEASIDFRFVERIVSGELASERGIFRIEVVAPGEDQRVFYGRFHTFARKVHDRWRIAVDYDSDGDGAVTDEMFLAGARIDDVAAFAV